MIALYTCVVSYCFYLTYPFTLYKIFTNSISRSHGWSVETSCWIMLEHAHWGRQGSMNAHHSI